MEDLFLPPSLSPSLFPHTPSLSVALSDFFFNCIALCDSLVVFIIILFWPFWETESGDRQLSLVDLGFQRTLHSGLSDFLHFIFSPLDFFLFVFSSICLDMFLQPTHAASACLVLHGSSCSHPAHLLALRLPTLLSHRDLQSAP